MANIRGANVWRDRETILTADATVSETIIRSTRAHFQDVEFFVEFRFHSNVYTLHCNGNRNARSFILSLEYQNDSRVAIHGVDTFAHTPTTIVEQAEEHVAD